MRGRWCNPLRNFSSYASFCSSVHAERMWRSWVARAPIENRSTDLPSSTVRVNSTLPVALACSISRSVAASPSRSGEAQQVERMRGDDLEPLVGGDQFGEQLGQLDVLADHLLHRLDTVDAQVEPQLQRPETAAERHLPVAVVDHRAALGRLRTKVLGQDAQRAEQGLRSDVQNRSQSKLMPIHLCGLVQ